MIRFSDETVIKVSSGNGGNGCVAFRREKYVPNGGPSGGDGGRGGDVIFVVKKNLRTLTHIHRMQHFKAKNGEDGSGRQKFGKNGDDVIISVPPGTILKNAETKKIIKEFDENTLPFTFLKGGNGGWGNVHFKSAINQSPRIANKGMPGETCDLIVEMSIIADVGLVGFPNAGKSSLLNFFTNARPKIAPYPFTTKIPNLGVLRANYGDDIIIADIPGIIENAGDGKGLGTRFLKHISRTKLLIFMIDLSSNSYLSAFDTLKLELEKFSPKLLEKPYIIFANKLDEFGTDERFLELQKKYKGEKILAMSITSRIGLDDAKKAILDFVASNCEENNAKEKVDHPSSINFSAHLSDENVQYPGEEN